MKKTKFIAMKVTFLLISRFWRLYIYVYVLQCKHVVRRTMCKKTKRESSMVSFVLLKWKNKDTESSRTDRDSYKSKHLMYKNDEKWKHFIKHIRAYNMMFSFTSLGGTIDTSINKGGAPYVFRLHGSNYHQIGINNRINALSGRNKDDCKRLNEQIVDELKMMVDEIETGDGSSFKMRLIERRAGDGRTHNLPTAS
ncbi:hypothetical protein ACS0TY_022236 [Phlomoides rotata]